MHDLLKREYFIHDFLSRHTTRSSSQQLIHVVFDQIVDLGLFKLSV